MKATVVEIQSKQYSGYKDRIICLQFVFPEYGKERLRFPECSLGIVGLALDDEVEVRFSVKRKEILSESLPTQSE